MSDPTLAPRPRWWLRRAEDIAALLLLSMAVSFLVQIIWRYVLNAPQGWTVEYVAIAWLWGILFGYAFVVRDADIIRLDIVYNALPPKGRAVADVLGGSVVAGLLLYSLPASVEYVNFMGIERTAFLQIGFNWVFAIYLPFVAVVTLRTLFNVFKALRQLAQAEGQS